MPAKKKKLEEIVDMPIEIPAELVHEQPAPAALPHPGALMDEGRAALLANDLPAILGALDKIEKLMRVHGGPQAFPALQELQLLLMNKQNALQNK
jgi:hypothetical protein